MSRKPTKKKGEKGQSMKELALECAQERAGQALKLGWDKIWEAKQRALKEHTAQNKDENSFQFGVAVSITLKPKGADMEIPAEAKWTVAERAKAKPATVSEHPELFDKKTGKNK